jgi:uncharacterized protein (TIRG00374 family)
MDDREVSSVDTGDDPAALRPFGVAEGPAGEPELIVDEVDLDDGGPVTTDLPSEQTRSFRRFLRARRRALLALVGMGAVVGFIFAVLPQLAGFGSTLQKLRHGDKSWLAVSVVFELLSLAGYIALLRTVFSCHRHRIGWSASYQITMAGVVATKLFAAAGAGGVALTVWALRASGLEARSVARRMASFEVLLYSVYMASLVLVGVGLATHVLSGQAPAVMTIVPACFGAIVIALVLAFKFLPADIAVRLRRLRFIPARAQRLVEHAATVPRTVQEGITTALTVVREPQLGLLGAVAYWGFDIAALWAAFRAFGAAPAVSIVVMAYFVGMLANTIPLPGGIGGVEGGMIGAFLAFGVNGSTTILAALAYRAVSFWLPTLPGIVAYFQLRRTVAGWRRPPGSATAAGARRPRRTLAPGWSRGVPGGQC